LKEGTKKGSPAGHLRVEIGGQTSKDLESGQMESRDWGRSTGLKEEKVSMKKTLANGNGQGPVLKDVKKTRGGKGILV